MPRKGSSQFGPDIIVGSPEYWRLVRAKNKDSIKLSQERYRVRQQQAYLASQLAVEDGISIEQALQEVGVDKEALKLLLAKYKNEGRINDERNPREDHLIVSPDARIPGSVFDEFAKSHNISYEDAERIMRTFDKAEEWEAAIASCTSTYEEVK